jgi:RNA polymerase sigma-70 factor (ECF subfamily)
MGPELRVKMQSMDVVQDALLGAFRDLDNFTYKNEGDFLRWVSSIAENRIRDHIEHFHAQKRDHRKEIPLIQDSTESSSRIRFDPMDLTTPSMIMARKEDLDNLETAMDKLKPEYREVILLTRIDGLSYKEAAEKMKRSEGSVRMLLVRALSSLSSLLEGEDA